MSSRRYRLWRAFLWIFAMIGTAVLMVLSSCVYERAESGPNQAHDKEEPEKVQLVVWGWGAAVEGLNLNMEDFRAEYPHIDVQFQSINNSELYQKFLVAANTRDEIPDVVVLETSNLAQMVSIGALYDITDRVSPYFERMNAFKWADAMMDDRIYAMPWDTGPVVMFYRPRLFEQAGLPSDPDEVARTVRTFADYAHAGEMIKRHTDAYLLSDSMHRSNNRFFETMMWQQGLWYFDKEGRVILDSPEVIAIGQYMVSLFENGYVYPAEPWSDRWIEAITSGRVATIVGASWYDNVLPIWLDPESAGEWAVAPMPLWSEHAPYKSANDGGSNLAINAHTRYPEEAWQFIEFMLGRESSQLKMMKEGGFFPSLETTYNDLVFSEPLPYYGGQPVRKLFVEAVQSIYPQAYTADFPLANELMADAFARVFLNDEPVEQVFKETADTLRSRTGRW